MDINKIEIFMKAIDNGSLLKTADKLDYSQAGLTHMMNSIENELGITLLKRGKFGIKLTEEGERIVPLFKDIVKLNKKLNMEVQLIKDQKASIIRIGAISSVIRSWLPDIMIGFQKENPEITFEITEGDDRLYQWFDQGSIDISISSNMFMRDDFIPLTKDYFYAVLPPDYQIPSETFNFDGLKEEAFIFPSCANDLNVEKVLEEHQVKSKNKNTYADDGSVISMVSRGFGVSILPQLVLKNYNEKVKVVKLDTPCFRTIGILYNMSANTSPSVKKFASYIKKWKF